MDGRQGEQPLDPADLADLVGLAGLAGPAVGNHVDNIVVEAVADVVAAAFDVATVAAGVVAGLVATDWGKVVHSEVAVHNQNSAAGTGIEFDSVLAQKPEIDLKKLESAAVFAVTSNRDLVDKNYCYYSYSRQPRKRAAVAWEQLHLGPLVDAAAWLVVAAAIADAVTVAEV